MMYCLQSIAVFISAKDNKDYIDAADYDPNSNPMVRVSVLREYWIACGSPPNVKSSRHTPTAYQVKFAASLSLVFIACFDLAVTSCRSSWIWQGSFTIHPLFLERVARK